MTDWKKIKREYIAGGTSYRKLAEKYNVPFGTLREVAKREKWPELKAQAQHDANTKIIDAESDKQAERMKKLLTVSDMLLEAVEDAVKQFNAGELILEKGALKSLSGTIKDIKEIQNIKSKLDIEEQKARIANLRRQAEADNEKNSDIEVIFEAGPEAWNE